MVDMFLLDEQKKEYSSFIASHIGFAQKLWTDVPKDDQVVAILANRLTQELRDSFKEYIPGILSLPRP